MSHLWQAPTGQRLPLQTAGYHPGDRMPQGSAISTLSVPPRHTGLEPDFGSPLGASDARIASSAGQPGSTSIASTPQWITDSLLTLAHIVGRADRTIDPQTVVDHWDRIGQFYASLESGHTTASVALQRLVSCTAKNHFYRANRDLGRIFKTEFLLGYLSEPP